MPATARVPAERIVPLTGAGSGQRLRSAISSVNCDPIFLVLLFNCVHVRSASFSTMESIGLAGLTGLGSPALILALQHHFRDYIAAAALLCVLVALVIKHCFYYTISITEMHEEYHAVKRYLENRHRLHEFEVKKRADGIYHDVSDQQLYTISNTNLHR